MCCWSLTDPNPIIVYFVAVQYILRLLTVNVKNFLTPKMRKCATTFWYLYWKCNPIIVNPVVKMWPIQRHMPISLVQGSIPPPPTTHTNAYPWDIDLSDGWLSDIFKSWIVLSTSPEKTADILWCLYCFPCKMTSEEWAGKFHTDETWLPKSE